MEPEHKNAYDDMQETLKRTMRQNGGFSGMRFIASYLNSMYQYCDMPFNFGSVYAPPRDEKENPILLCTPQSFDMDEFVPSKYQAMTDLIDEQMSRGRKTMVYVKFTGKRSVDSYLHNRLKAQGYNVGILKREGTFDGIKMPTREDREQWVRDQMQEHDWDVMITNFDLVSVGLNLTMFPTIIYYQMDYSVYNYMQSSRRSWRIKQTQPVEIYTLVYRDTIQSVILSTIAAKIDATLALQGKFSEEGLRAMAETCDGLNALAKKIVSEGKLESIDSIEARWQKINEQRALNLKTDSFEYANYTDAIMNPLGLDRIREIASGIVDLKSKDFEDGKITASELETYLMHMHDLIQAVDADEINKGRKKKDFVDSDQLAFIF